MLRHAIPFVALLASVAAAEDVSWVPVPVYEVESIGQEPGKPLDTRTREYVGVSQYRVKEPPGAPTGYKEEVSKDRVTVGGKEFAAEKRVWTRDPAVKYASHAFGTLTIWRSDEIKAAAFTLPLSREADLAIPSGCLRVETGGKPVDDGEASFVRLAWSGESEFSTKERKFTVQEYDMEVRKEKDSLKGRLKVAADVDGGICSVECDVTGRRSVKGTETLKSVHDLPVPAGIVAFRKAGFGFAPPPGYEQEKAAAEDVASFRNKAGESIRISTVDLGGKDFEAWWNALPMGEFGAHHGSNSVPFSITMCTMAGFDGSKSGEMRWFFGRSGKGYRVTISNGVEMKDADVQALVAGWRWIKN